MPSRKYEQHLRAESAEATRQRILDVLARQLRKAPNRPISLDLIAQRAKVARSTIYTIFGSRAGLFEAFVERLWARTGLAELTEAVSTEDPAHHLRAGLAAASRMYAADRGIYRVLYSLGQIDPDTAGAAVAKMEKERAGGMAHLARRLADSRLLRPDVTVDQAAHILWVLCSFDTFDALYTQRGLPLDEAVDQIATMAERTLYRTPQGRSAR
jgi:AcrR family transcriptional regulator